MIVIAGLRLESSNTPMVGAPVHSPEYWSSWSCVLIVTLSYNEVTNTVIILRKTLPIINDNWKVFFHKSAQPLGLWGWFYLRENLLQQCSVVLVLQLVQAGGILDKYSRPTHQHLYSVTLLTFSSLQPF